METIFDYNPTEYETKHIAAIPKELYLSLIDEDSANFHLAVLFYNRGEYKKMKKYANRIKDVNLRNSFWRTVTHPKPFRI